MRLDELQRAELTEINRSGGAGAVAHGERRHTDAARRDEPAAHAALRRVGAAHPGRVAVANGLLHRRMKAARAGDRRAAFQLLYGVVVDNVNVSVLLYVPVRSGSLALTSCLNAIATLSLETGAVQLALPSTTRSGSASENAPLVR